MFRKFVPYYALIPALFFGFAQAEDWTTFGGDPQRTGWARDEIDLTKDNIKNLKLEWKLKLNNTPAEMNYLTAPVVHSKVITPHGFKEVALIAGAADKIFAIDSDTGKIDVGKNDVDRRRSTQKPHWLCPNSLNATPVIDSRTRTAYVASSDGKLHALNMVNGEDRFAPVQFFPAFAKPWSLNLVKGVVYTVTSQRRNGGSPCVYSMNVADPDHKVSYFEVSTAGAGIWGRAGAAITSTGNILVETGDESLRRGYRQAVG